MTSFFWLVGILIPFILAQEWLHREIQMIVFYITRSQQLAVGVFSVLFLPGVALHELSHWLVAKIFGVPVRRFSIIPKVMSKNKVRMGVVEVAASNPVLDALIGLAPLIFGFLAIALIGILLLDLPAYFSGNFNDWLGELNKLPSIPDFWIWFYFIFVISSTMLPSSSDRKSWPPILIFLGILLIVLLILGAGGWISKNLMPTFELVFSILAAVVMVSLAVHLILGVPLFFIRKLLERVMGVRAVF